MAKKIAAASVAPDDNPPAIEKPKKPRGPRGIKLALPPGIQGQLNGLPDLYPKLKAANVQGRFMALLSPSLEAAYQSSFDQLVNDLETERTARVQALRNPPEPAINVAPDPDGNPATGYVALDSETAQ